MFLVIHLTLTSYVVNATNCEQFVRASNSFNVIYLQRSCICSVRKNLPP